MPTKLRSYRSRRSRALTIVISVIGSFAALAVLLVVTFYWNDRSPNIVIPTPPMPQVNAYDDFLQAAQMAGAIPHKSPSSMPNPPTTRAEFLAATQACAQDAAPALAVMRQGFNKPSMLPTSRNDLGIANMHAFAQFRELARTISGVEMYYELTGQPGKAADVALDGAEMAVMFPRGGALIADLVGAACESISLARFESLLPQLSPTELSVVAARLERISAKRGAYSEIVLEEGREGAATLQQSFRDPKYQGFRARFKMARSYVTFDDSHRLTPRETWETFKFSMANKTALIQSDLDYFNKLAVEVQQPFTGATKVPLPNNLIGELHGQMYSVVGRQQHVAKQAVLDLLRIETALYRYKASKGSYPNSLEEVAPVLLKAVPGDPFGQGKPFIYRGQGSSFSLYSVGADMKDDGGRPAKGTNQPGGDIVAGQLSQAKPLPAQ
jgi:hypothetical protein